MCVFRVKRNQDPEMEYCKPPCSKRGHSTISDSSTGDEVDALKYKKDVHVQINGEDYFDIARSKRDSCSDLSKRGCNHTHHMAEVDRFDSKRDENVSNDEASSPETPERVPRMVDDYL